VPEDIALVSFDEPVSADLLDPPMTSLDRHDEELGRIAAAALLRALEGDDGPGDTVRVPAVLSARRSCGCEPGA
jgi:DNA-binding LacI/PurR family transcriptional regulator